MCEDDSRRALTVERRHGRRLLVRRSMSVLSASAQVQRRLGEEVVGSIVNSIHPETELTLHNGIGVASHQLFATVKGYELFVDVVKVGEK